ncbi:MAG: tyrosine-type recombinase/integrase [Bacteroidota bacterium]
MESVVDYIERKYRASTRPGYRYGIRIYLNWIGGETSAQVATYADVIDYLKHLRKQELNARTVNNYLFAVKIYYHYLRSTKQRKDHPCERLKLKDQYDRSIHLESLYSTEQLKQLANSYHCKDHKLLRRNQVILGLLIHQALTVSEITHLKTDEVDLRKSKLQVPAVGNNRARKLPLKPEQILLINDYWHEDRNELLNQKDHSNLILNQYGDPLAPHSISRIINKGKATAHRFLPRKIRQSVIHNLLKAGHDLRVVQAFAGHRQLATTEAYRQTELEELKVSIEKYHPRQ